MKSWIYLLTTLWLLTACKADTEPEPETTQPVVPQHVAVTFNPEAAATRGPVPAGSLGTDLSFRVWAQPLAPRQKRPSSMTTQVMWWSMMP